MYSRHGTRFSVNICRPVYHLTRPGNKAAGVSWRGSGECPGVGGHCKPGSVESAPALLGEVISLSLERFLGCALTVLITTKPKRAYHKLAFQQPLFSFYLEKDSRAGWISEKLLMNGGKILPTV